MDISIIVFLCYFVAMALLVGLAYRHYKQSLLKDSENKEKDTIKRTKYLLSSLYQYTAHPEILRVINREGMELAGGHAGNYTWKEMTEYFCKAMGLKHLRYSTIGSQYRLVNLETDEKFNIPTDNTIDEPIEKSGLKNGQILLIEKIT